MPKLKTRKSIAKRVKRTATGKGGKRKRQMRKDGVLQPCMDQRIKKALPYG